MRSLSPYTLLAALFLLLLCLPAFAQENGASQNTPVRVCVAELLSGTNMVSVTEARDRLVKALDKQKPDKKLGVSATAIPLLSASASNTLAEARAKQCDFVLATHLTDFHRTQTLSNNGAAGMTYIPAYIAIVEYRVVRVADGAGFAIGSVQQDDLNSQLEPVWQAIGRIAHQALADIAKGGNVPHLKTAVASQTSKPGEERVFVPDPCAWMPSDIPHAGSVRGVCEYAVSLPVKMPNFICDQDASRYRGKSDVPFDLITASVRYEDGKESYREIKVNGKAVLTPPPGIWSTGGFGSNLSSIFDTWNQPIFEFSREAKFEDRPVWVFTYEIVKQNDPLWRLHGEDQVLAPSYKGELWVDQKNGELLRFGSVAREIPQAFPMSGAELQIDYARVLFGDGSSFVLPRVYTVTTTYRGQEPTRNVVQFRNCQEFRAKTRVVLNAPGLAGAAVEEAEGANSAELERRREEEETIYAILREQALREDAAQLEAEERQDLELDTVGAIWKLSALEKRRQKNLAVLAASGKAEPSTELPETTLKVRVKLVQVDVVLRDSKGNAVGNLRKEDFQLFDNGKLQPITSFSAERSSVAAASQKPPPEIAAEKGRAAAFAGGTVPAPVGREVAYVFDDMRATFEDLAGARDAAMKHIDALRSEDRAAIFTTSGQIGMEFTADRERLQNALKNLKPHPIARGPKCPPMTPFIADLIVNQSDLEALKMATEDAESCALGGVGDYSRAEQLAKSAAFETLNTTSAETQGTLGVLREVIQRLSTAAGSRRMVLVSPGFLTLGPETRQSVEEMIDTAVRANIVLNTLDVRGLYTPGMSPDLMHPSNPVLRLALDRDEALTRSEVMADLAYSTGGSFFHNNNDLNEGFRRTADAPEFVYVLGFSPQKLDGKFHKLKVKVAAPARLTVQARQGYYALTPGIPQ